MSTATTTPTEPQPAAAPAPADAPDGLLARLSDRLNPILVREVQQAIKGRVFMLAVIGALFVNVVIALVAAGRGRGEVSGRGVFDAGLASLAPLLLFVVPMQAYMSMQSELRGGMIEQLLMSELRPLRIVAGKLGAAMVQFLLYLSVLSPLLATSYLLRGVDVPTIVFCLSCALVFCVAATSFAIAAALQGTIPAMRPLALLGMAFGLGIASVAMVGYIGSGECNRDVGWLLRSSDFGMVTSAVLLGAVVGTVLMALIAQAFLAHSFENRSTGFRLFLLALPPLTFGWIFAFVPTRGHDEVIPVMTVMLTFAGILFAVFMVSEQRQLSPRVQAHVPRRGALAALAAVVLPGRDRGVACFALYLLLLGGLAAAFWPPTRTSGWMRWPQFMSNMASLAVAYAMLYLTLGKLLRARLPETVLGNHATRFLMPLMVVVGILLPVLFDVVVIGEVDNWHPGHALNPFWTIERAMRDSGEALRYVIWFVGAGLLVLQLPAIGAGVREVLAASRRRRSTPRAEVAAGAA